MVPLDQLVPGEFALTVGSPEQLVPLRSFVSGKFELTVGSPYQLVPGEFALTVGSSEQLVPMRSCPGECALTFGSPLLFSLGNGLLLAAIVARWCCDCCKGCSVSVAGPHVAPLIVVLPNARE